MTFHELGLNPMILQALDEIDFVKPTPIQTKTIPHLINSDNDLMALAQTGTGKTAAFSLPIIQQVDHHDKTVQALIICPTRELAIQIDNDIKNFTKYLPDVRSLAVFGGQPIERQIQALKKKPQIIIGTPGRLNDLIRRRLLKLHYLRWLVLDEADEMLNMGFKEELDEILETVPETKQSLLFSATMNKSIRSIAKNYMHKPEEITIGTENFYCVVNEKDRYNALRRIADSVPNIHGIIFCRTRRETQEVADRLLQDHYSAEAIHGDIPQAQRSQVMNKFRDGKIQLLVATDVAARGIDVSGLTHVINYKVPESSAAYVHRSGRTGRAHNSGTAVLIINSREQYHIKQLEKKIGKEFTKGRIPTGSDICEKQLFHLVEKICDAKVNEEQIDKYFELIQKKFASLDREQLIKKLISTEFNKFLEYYQDASDLNNNVPAHTPEKNFKKPYKGRRMRKRNFYKKRR